MKRIIWSIFGFLLTATAHAAGFDCAKASTRVEKMICNTASISKLDSELQDEYAKALAHACDASELKKFQRQWLTLRDRSKDEKELSNQYEQQLEWFKSHAQPSHTEYSVINRRLGKYKFEITPGQCIEYRFYPHQVYRVTVFGPTEKRMQEIEIQSPEYPDKVLSISDMDRDGYKDLLFYLGVGHGPYPFISLYRYHPETNTFEQDKSFPFEGGVKESPHKGCVYVENRTSLGNAEYGYDATEYCLSSETGEWNEVTTCAESDKNKCP